MDDVVDMIAKGASASEVSDRLKDILMQKSAANIDEVRPNLAFQFAATKRRRKKRKLQKLCRNRNRRRTNSRRND